MTHNAVIQDARLSSPYRNVAAAIGIIQAHILASDTSFDRSAMFGTLDYTDTLPLEAALSLLLAVVGPSESLTWQDAGAGK